MCLIGFSLNPDSAIPLLLAANRDEFYERPTSPAGWWSDKADIFAGRDLQAGGTWLGVNRLGRLAALTNFREGLRFDGSRSRGALVASALDTNVPLDECLESLARQRNEYAGFSLLIFDWRRNAAGAVTGLTGHCVSNRGGEDPIAPLSNDVHGLSNGPLNAPWPKSERLIGTIRSVRAGDAATGDHLLLETLTDGAMALLPGQELPNTGVGAATEQELAPAFVFTGARGYGTKSTAIIRLSQDSKLAVQEWSWDSAAQPTSLSRRAAQFISGRRTPYPATSNQP